jgi:outer membrane lipopolysaccharide assembly protein LptE/RlpB
MAASGCGYHLTENSFLPADIHTVYIEPFINRSRDIGLEKELTTALRSEFYRRGQLTVVDNQEQADAIISGVVRQLTSNIASVNRHNEVLQFEAALTVDVAVRRRDPDVMLWQAQGLRLSRIYSGSRAAVVTTSSEFATGTLSTNDVRRLTDIQVTESAARDSRYELMSDFAADLRQRLIEMF